MYKIFLIYYKYQKELLFPTQGEKERKRERNCEDLYLYNLVVMTELPSKEREKDGK